MLAVVPAVPPTISVLWITLRTPDYRSVAAASTWRVLVAVVVPMCAVSLRLPTLPLLPVHGEDD